jgi:chromosome segregation ATPase
MTDLERARAEAEQARGVSNLYPFDGMRRYKAEAAESTLATLVETERRQREARYDHRERDRQMQVVPAVDWDEVDRRIDEKLMDAAERMGGLLGESLNEVVANFKRELTKRDAKIQTLRDVLEAKVDARIEQRCSGIVATLGTLSESLVTQQKVNQAALDQHDREIKGLRNEIEVRITLDRKLARTQRALEAAQRRQPNFEAELNALQEKFDQSTTEIAALKKQLLRVRGEQSQLDFGLKQTEKRMTLTSIEVSSIGAQTRTALEALREIGDWEPPGPAS